MDAQQDLNRRKWIKMGLGVAAGTAATAFTFSRLPTVTGDCQLTPRQELGPFPPMKARTQPDHDVDLIHVSGQTGTATGDVIIVKGKVLDEKCVPVAGAIVEIWQSNHFGKYHHEYDTKGEDDPNFQGWGEAITNAAGEYRFTTIVPGLYEGRTRHIHYKVSKRGYHELVTQLYFSGEDRNKKDGLFNQLTHEEQLLVTRPIAPVDGKPTIDFDISISRLKKGTVPEKVLLAYVGEYLVQPGGTGFERFLQSLGGPHQTIRIHVKHEGGKLYFGLPVAPMSEATWKEKDRFDASSFYSSELEFLRGNDGKVNALVFTWKDNDPMKAEKIS